ncbi:hypothetical protein GIY23_00635 [Allosaccharopolyspora coralli]|uniref:Uncharacterized protein n=2 Tax=Allosaccharopolyspora coralli TaxID=2665642 RepID=A0A5Q3QBV6_9PSEU|nr:hypothetical protein GIY23_00635 [Allosaccharopolyspora coralli]
MRFQDAETATPREPTLAEKRARVAAEKRRDEKEQAEVAEATRKSDQRRKVLIGSGVTVGVVALVAAFYSGSAYSTQKNAVEAQCTVQRGGETIAQPDEHCDENYARENGGQFIGGMWMMPIFLPGGGFGGYPQPGQYRYSYSSPGTQGTAPGQRVANPNFNAPSGNTKVTTKSGSTVQRGGFGIGNKGPSGG